jgi:DNA-binding transcriptional LysR family regulator
MKFNQLREVLAIAEHGSIRAAARALDTGQPALTRSLAELERDLGATLFERRARGVVATSLGQVFVRRAASILSEVRRARDELDQLGGSTAGCVTAGLSIAAHLALLPPALRPFVKRYPDVNLHVIEGFYPTLEAGLRDGTIDFYVGVDSGQIAPELSREILGQNRRTVLCRAGHPLENAKSLAELSGASWATTSITLGNHDEIGAVFEQNGLPPPKLSFRSQSALTLMTFLLYSDHLAMVPVQWSQSDLARGMLATIPIREELAASPTVVIKRSDLLLTPAATYLLDLIKRQRLLPQPKSSVTRPVPAGQMARR